MRVSGLLPTLFAALAFLVLFGGGASAHPGIESATLRCHEDDCDDEKEHIRAAVAEDKEDDKCDES